jgi:hypothetical protein
MHDLAVGYVDSGLEHGARVCKDWWQSVSGVQGQSLWWGSGGAKPYETDNILGFEHIFTVFLGHL